MWVDTAAKLLTMSCICDVSEHVGAPANFGGITSVITHTLRRCVLLWLAVLQQTGSAVHFLFYGQAVQALLTQLWVSYLTTVSLLRYLKKSQCYPCGQTDDR